MYDGKRIVRPQPNTNKKIGASSNIASNKPYHTFGQRSTDQKSKGGKRLSKSDIKSIVDKVFSTK